MTINEQVQKTWEENASKGFEAGDRYAAENPLPAGSDLPTISQVLARPIQLIAEALAILEGTQVDEKNPLARTARALEELHRSIHLVAAERARQLTLPVVATV